MFTDIEGSTRLLQRLGDGYAAVQAAHDAVMRRAIADASGVEVRTIGDAFFAVFRSAPAAVVAAATAQRMIHDDPTLAAEELRVRIGLHTGEGRLGGDDYIGIDVNRAARIGAAAHGSQVLLSGTTAGLVGDRLPDGVTLRDAGLHSLKDLADKVQLTQLVISGLPSEFPTLRTLEAVPNNLPADLSTFVGRQDVLRMARKLLDRNRLLTLTGPGGVGKTRLSLHLAAEVADAYPDGVYFVQLSAITNADLIPTEVLEALRVPAAQAGVDPAQHLATYLADRSVLLVLDNFEQILDGAALVGDVLAHSPESSAIVTSRAALHVRGEQEMEVPPLETAEPAEGAVPEELRLLEAVELFGERAAEVKPTFTVDDTNVADIARLTTRLDGLPLAIELAAAWVKVLPPATILDHLGERVLRAGHRDAGSRQRTLHDTIAWSYDLLDPPARRLFERLSVFAGSAGLAEIEQVCGIELGMDPLTGISTLVDHSLLNQFERLGEPRYRMLLTIRDFAAERLAERGEHSDIADRHSATYLGWAEAAEPHLTADEPGIWLDRFTLEHDNLRAALHHSIDAGHADEAARLGYNVWRFWHMRGHLIEGRRALDLVLELPGSRPEARAKALEAAGGVAYWQGDMTAAGVHYEAALALQQQLGDETAIAYALYNLSFAYLFGHGPRKAVALLEDSLDRFERLSDERGIAVATWGLGNGYLELERRQDAHEAFRRSTAAFERLGEPFNLGWSLYSMGETDVSLGHHDEAREHFERGIRLFADANDLSAVVMFMAGFAAVAVLQGDGERAARLAGALAKLRERTGTDLVEVGSAAAHVVSTNRELDQLGADHLEAFAEGRRMTPATAVGYALGELDASGLPTRANS